MIVKYPHLLATAYTKQWKEAVDYLLELEIDIGQSALLYPAVYANDLNTVRKLLAHPFADPTNHSSDLVVLTTSKGHMEMRKLLISDTRIAKVVGIGDTISGVLRRMFGIYW